MSSGGRRGTVMVANPGRRGTVMGKAGAANAAAAKQRRRFNSKEDPKWTTEEKWAPMRRLSTPELGAARRMFFELDRDGSGSIDVEELGVMMRSLGQMPTEQELKDLIDSVDGGDRDGQIQLREFLVLYQRGLEDKGKVGAGDLNNCFMAMGGDCRDASSKVAADKVHETMLADFDLVRVPPAHSRLAHLGAASPRHHSRAMPRAQTPSTMKTAS